MEKLGEHLRLRVFVLFVGSGFGFVAFADEPDLSKDWRSDCKTAIGGVLMSQASDLDLLDKSIAALVKKQKELAAAKKKNDQMMIAFKNDWKHHEYDPSYQDKNTELMSRDNLLRQQQQENDSFLKENQAKQKVLKERHQALFKRAEKVFTIKRETAKDADTRLRLEYRRACPAYSDVCALTSEESRHLLAVLPDDQTPLACLRYTKIR